MKILASLLLTTVVLLLAETPAKSQVKVDVEKKVERKVNQRANKKTDQAIDKSLDKVEEGLGDIFRKKKNRNKSQAEESGQSQPGDEHTEGSQDKPAEGPTLYWSKYDFIPGDRVIFEDNLADEENGEFPSRWDLVKGNVEIAEFGEEKVIMFRDGASSIIPYIKDPDKDYLPDIFTIEFDVYYDKEPHSAKYFVHLYDLKNQKGSPLNKISLFPGGISGMKSEKIIPGKQLWYNHDKPFWRHISIGFNIRALKVYYDAERMLNIPNLGFNPTGFTVEILNTKPLNFYIKNIRIAAGGQKLYDKLMQDGKIISNGIRFNVNKATLKPESMGIINEIADLMKKNPGISFSVEGHTDSDGSDIYNQTLSEQRAATVVSTLVNLGIDSGRLTYTGWGESKPLDTNSTAEGKANNRRVEFVKQ
ncbi:MAG: OmpA family protein [Lentimicrobium sp.]|nr:OmpA family protein [Lentimicrobium sp.]